MKYLKTQAGHLISIDHIISIRDMVWGYEDQWHYQIIARLVESPEEYLCSGTYPTEDERDNALRYNSKKLKRIIGEPSADFSLPVRKLRR